MIGRWLGLCVYKEDKIILIIHSKTIHSTSNMSDQQENMDLSIKEEEIMACTVQDSGQQESMENKMVDLSIKEKEKRTVLVSDWNGVYEVEVDDE